MSDIPIVQNIIDVNNALVDNDIERVKLEKQLKYLQELQLKEVLKTVNEVIDKYGPNLFIESEKSRIEHKLHLLSHS